MKSLQDYINPSEAIKVLLTTIGAGSFTQLALTLAVALFSSAGQWYTGPYGAVVVSLLSAVAAGLAGKKTAHYYLAKGEQIATAPPARPK